jgi:hypothetical protein
LDKKPAPGWALVKAKSTIGNKGEEKHPLDKAGFDGNVTIGYNPSC